MKGRCGKVSLTIHFITLPESRCRRRVGRASGCPIQVVKDWGWAFDIVRGVRKIRDLRQAGPGPGLSFYSGLYYSGRYYSGRYLGRIIFYQLNYFRVKGL